VFPLKTYLKAAALKQSPVRGTLLFAVVYSAIKFLADWTFRWRIPDRPEPPMWSVILTIAIGSAIASLVVFLLLTFMQRQQRALEELNHELRNALQILSYSVNQCDKETRPKAQQAIETLSDAVRRISQKLGMVSEREYRPK
jgi:two-component sensor histidine kinase